MPAPEPDITFDDDRGWLRAELLAAVEVCGLTGLAVTRPVLDSFGRAPETFLVRGAGRWDVVLFALAVAVVPAVVVAVAGAATGLAGRRVRRWAHLVVVGLLGGLVLWRFGTDATTWGSGPLVAAAVAGGLVLLVLRWRVRPVATYLRFVGAASLVFVVQFLVFSPASSLATGGVRPPADEAATEAVLAGTGGEPPPVVVVVVDALPTTSLLDGTGHIDRELYPHLAGLADDATWYRNHTTTSGWTFQAMPAMLSGQLPRTPSPLPDLAAYPHNLFTLFAGTHDVEGVEQLTRLCPDEVCPQSGGGGLSALLGDAAAWWRGALDPRQPEGAQILPGALEPERGDDFRRWIDDQDFTLGGRPGMWFYHLVMPHDPWHVLDDLSQYATTQDEIYGLFLGAFWGEVGTDVARQRQILQTQAVDALVGRLLDRLRAAGTYDDTLVVVAGDHGESFVPSRPRRGLTAEQYEHVAWTPLLVKPPGGGGGTVDDTNLWNVDLLPTIAAEMGVELPWEVDGVAPTEAATTRDPGAKLVLDSDFHELEREDGGAFVPIDGRAGLDRVLGADLVPGEGEHAVWQRTAHGALVGREVTDLAIEQDGVGTITIDQLDRIERPGDAPPVLEVLGECRLQAGQVVALAVNDVVAAVAPVQPVSASAPGEDRIVHALLLPDPFTDTNDIDAYLVDGEPGAETLRLLTVVG